MRCIKLLLDPGQSFPVRVDKEQLLRDLDLKGKSPVQVAADYLTQLNTVLFDHLNKTYGEAVVAEAKIKTVLTVPAVWSDAAKDATLRAAEMAGMNNNDNNLTMISEPEAAAIHTLSAVEDQALAVGDVFIVCDAGGGTVDLITYKAETVSPLTLSEVVPGNGFLCGGAFLNVRFQACIRRRLGSEVYDTMMERKPRTWATALKYFEEYVKRNFDPSDDQSSFDDTDFDVPVPGLADNEAPGIESGFMSLSTAEVGEIFRPVVAKIVELVEKQRRDTAGVGLVAKGVILAGGFGQSLHLYKTLLNRLANQERSAPSHDSPPAYDDVIQPGSGYSEHGSAAVSGTLVILQSKNAWTAVVRGAVLRGLEESMSVVSRRARRHYGLYIAPVWDASKHSAELKYYDKVFDVWRAKDRIAWFVKKGESILFDTPVKVLFTDTSSTFGRSAERIINYCDSEDAPDDFRSADIHSLCRIPVDLSTLPRRHWVARQGSDGVMYQTLAYQVTMQVDSGGLRFSLEVDGVNYGSVKAVFD